MKPSVGSAPAQEKREEPQETRIDAGHPHRQLSYVFTTRAALDGPVDLQKESADFEVASIFPDDETQFKTMDFSAFRLRTSHPVDEETVVYGDTVTLTQDGETVPAYLRVDGRHISIDPQNELSSGSDVTLELSNGVQNLYGEELAGGFTRTFSPRNTKPRETLVQEAAQIYV